MDARYRTRPATGADLGAVHAVERAVFTDPWTRDGIADMMQGATSATFVACLRDEVIGYLMARRSGEEGEILNLAVLPGHRRRGVAAALLREGLAWLRAGGAGEVYLEVRESNGSARALYEGHGFRAVGMRPDYYRHPRESALVLRAVLTGPQ